MFAESTLGMAAAGSFGVVLLAAAAWDVRARRIPNALVACAALLGAGFAVAQLGVRNGLALALSGFVVGLVIWLPAWLLGMIGAGDVKLFAAGAAWLGPMAALRASLFAALAGGLLAIGWIIYARVGSTLLVRGRARVDADGAAVHALPAGALGITSSAPDEADFGRSLPYGVAMSIGLGVGAWLPHALR
jgi:prepilin peptidase CpaA